MTMTDAAKKPIISEEPGSHQWVARRSFEHGYLPMLHHLKLPNNVGGYALDLLLEAIKAPGKNWAEDSAGRQTFNRMAPDEMVNMCMDVAELAFKELHRRGLMMDIPTVEEAEEHYKDSN